MALSYAPTLPAGYFTRHGRDEFGQHCIALHCDRIGWLSNHDDAADAAYAAQEREAEAAEAESVSVSMHIGREDLVRAAADFLYALDRGDFGAGHRFSDGSESAYVEALRNAVGRAA